MIHGTHENYFGCSNMQTINHNKKMLHQWWPSFQNLYGVTLVTEHKLQHTSKAKVYHLADRFHFWKSWSVQKLPFPYIAQAFLFTQLFFEYFKKRLHAIRVGNVLLFLWCLRIKMTVLSIFLFCLLITQSGIYFGRFECFRIIYVSQKTLPCQIFNYYVSHV